MTMNTQPAPQWQSRNIVQALRAPQQQIGVREDPTLKIEGMRQAPMMSAAGAQQAGNDFGKMAKQGWDAMGGMDGISNLFGGAGGAGGAGAAGSLGPWAAAATAASIGADNLLNGDPDKFYSADKINSYGTVGVGGKDVGFRFGDLANGINPVTWLQDPKKGANGIFNFFTGGIFD